MIKAARYTYLVLVWLFLIGVVTQVFLAGMVVVAGLSNWEGHIGLGHTLGLPLIFMLISMYVGRMPSETKRLTWLLFLVYVIQADVVVFMRDSLPMASALHPVIALFDFAIGWVLARRAVGVAREAVAV